MRKGEVVIIFLVLYIFFLWKIMAKCQKLYSPWAGRGLFGNGLATSSTVTLAQEEDSDTRRSCGEKKFEMRERTIYK